MPIPARVSLVTLGVKDVARSTAFYVALGWPLSSASVPGDVSFFKTSGGLLAIWNEDLLAEDAGLARGAGGDRRGRALAINLESREDVDAALAAAAAAGARITKPAVATDWGGYNSYFGDSERHLWGG